MIRAILLGALAFASACSIVPAEAKQQRRTTTCTETGTLMAPVCGMTGFSPGIGQTSDGRRVVSIRVAMKRERRGARAKNGLSLSGKTVRNLSEWRPSEVTEGVARPARYIAGRLICAINVGAALAERGIRGTGSALARSYDRWGVRVARPVPGAVAVTDRRGGGHVAIVSRVEGGRVWAWNPSSRGRGWREVEYTGRHARYRVAG